MSGFSSLEFRRCLGQFATGVAVISTRMDGMLYGVTINSFTSLSLTPPLILFNLDKRSKSHAAFAAAPAFAVTILAADQQQQAELFASPERHTWQEIPHRLTAHRYPLLENALAYLECKRYAIHEGGDHSILIGEVEQLAVNDTLPEPLLYFRGKYGI